MTEVVPESDSVSRVVSGFSLDGPIAPRNRAAPRGHAVVWRAAGRLAERVLAASERKDAALSVANARRHLPAGGVIDPDFETLPSFADLALFGPAAALPLYRYARYLNELVPRAPGADLTLEIGPGAGLLSLGLHQLLGSRAVLIDLPPMLAVAFTVLAYLEGEDSISLPNEAGDVLPETPYVLLTPSQASLLSANSVDAAVNTASFQEMTYDAIRDYLALLDRVLKPGGVFYCANLDRCEKVDGSPIEFDHYAWPGSWETLFDRPTQSESDSSAVVRERLSRKPA